MFLYSDLFSRILTLAISLVITVFFLSLIPLQFVHVN